MTTSAVPRDVRRLTTERRVSDCAQRLADQHGLDGFTMEDLAGAAGVSRRTLFNYFPGKLDAILGPGPDLSEEALAIFRAGGPHHDLVEDLAVLAHGLLTDEALGWDEVARHRRLLRSSSRLLAAALDRFELMSERLVEEILAREGPTFDTARARVAIKVLGALFEVSLDGFLADPHQHAVADLFTDSLRTARELLA
ncbi:MAG: TetR family transcriptional regulator [Nocardioidaceae bacterium]